MIKIRGIIILMTLVQHKTPLPGFKQNDPDRKAGESASAWQQRWEPSKGPESQSRTEYAKLESNSKPERARVCQRVAVKASESQSGSHREP